MVTSLYVQKLGPRTFRPQNYEIRNISHWRAGCAACQCKEIMTVYYRGEGCPHCWKLYHDDDVSVCVWVGVFVCTRARARRPLRRSMLRCTFHWFLCTVVKAHERLLYSACYTVIRAPRQQSKHRVTGRDWSTFHRLVPVTQFSLTTVRACQLF